MAATVVKNNVQFDSADPVIAWLRDKGYPIPDPLLRDSIAYECLCRRYEEARREENGSEEIPRYSAAA